MKKFKVGDRVKNTGYSCSFDETLASIGSMGTIVEVGEYLNGKKGSTKGWTYYIKWDNNDYKFTDYHEQYLTKITDSPEKKHPAEKKDVANLWGNWDNIVNTSTEKE